MRTYVLMCTHVDDGITHVDETSDVLKYTYVRMSMRHQMFFINTHTLSLSLSRARALSLSQVPVRVEVPVYQDRVVEVKVPDTESAEGIELLKAQLARAYAGFEKHLRPLQDKIQVTERARER